MGEDDCKPPTMEKSKRFRFLVNTHLKIQKTLSQDNLEDDILSPSSVRSPLPKT